MSKEYLDYWGFKKDPFYLAPDNEMMYLGGQYYECFERLLYAVNTNKGGTLLVSEEAGLGKTTILLRLIAEMEWTYGEGFRHAFVDHPTLTAAQIISQITGSLTSAGTQGDKFFNLTSLREELTEVKKAGGKAIIVIDEAHMLGARLDVLQELRMLLNLTHEREYLFSMILSGQKPLWDMMKGIPEFWQRLPVKYYLIPLDRAETAALIDFRINRAGYEEDRPIFTEDALDIIQRFSKGLPRTIVALCDVCLLIGAAYHAGKIGFKEVTKAIHVMSGRGEEETFYYMGPQAHEGKSGAERSFFRSIMRKIKR